MDFLSYLADLDERVKAAEKLSPRSEITVFSIVPLLVFVLSLQPPLEQTGSHLSTTQTKGDGQGQANGAEDQNESPNDDLRSYLQYLKDAGNDKNNRCIVGHSTDTVRLLQSGVGTRSSGHCFDEVCQIETEDQHHNGSYNFRDVKKDRVEGLGDPG